MTEARLKKFFAGVINVTTCAALDGVIMRRSSDPKDGWAIHSYTISDKLRARHFRSAVEAFEALVAFREKTT